ncbi:hypothetical protein BKA67DRAFT_554809 [Truncatella angustata]|uniref:Uncharacterized protein n=1 Tax=Truncatella angustata TaxID=152316 RepID=A0A9P8URR7_9PEZI|nr:uncharacterized protein BKA67DRAFT_554809 [Truncatella angustata]KAH6657267.1 hypothetical protein BKA67DRAFT_554809 [Truncatella angustata]
MESKASRYQSRILREMHQNKENPFNSPPSSTGSHGTVTLTSDLSYGPEGESTRRMEDSSIMLPGLSNRQQTDAPPDTPFRVNTSAIARDFPEWKRWEDHDHTDDLYNVTGDYEKQQRKENIPPSSSTVNSPSQIEARKASGTYGTRAHMQARVEDESDCSGDLQRHKRPGSANKKSASWKPERGNVTQLISTLKAAQAVQESTPKKSSPRAPTSDRRSSANRHSRISNIQLAHTEPNQTARSFFLPNLEYINDFVSGVLRLSSVKNGIPVFVRHGKVFDQGSKPSPEHHAEVDAVEIPRDEQEIFVSLDKIREEIQTLQAHDDQVSKQAELLQDEMYELQVQLSSYKSRKDSAMGSDSDSSVVQFFSKEKAQLEEKMATLQAKLDKANRKISINEIHTETYVNERDEALKSASAQAEKISRLQAQLDTTRNELDVARSGGTLKNTLTNGEIHSLRDDNIALRSQYKSLLEENQSLRSHNASVTQQNTELQLESKRLQRSLDTAQEDRDLLRKELDNVTEQHRGLEVDQMGLERHNEKYYTENKSLQQKISLLERRIHDLQENNAQLHQMLDVANAETGTMTFDIKDIKNRLEKKIVSLSDENTQLQQKIIDLQEEFASKQVIFEQEKRRVSADNDRLHNKLDRMSQSFERVLQESRREFEEQRDSLTQQLDEVANREAALATRLRETTEKEETTLQQHIQRRNEAVEEAHRISREIQLLQSTAGKTKPAKVTRIVEPTTTRSRSTLSEVSAKSTTEHMDTQERDDLTQELDFTQGSDIDVLPRGEMDRLREALRQAKSDNQQNATEEYLERENEVGSVEDASQSLPPFLPQAQRGTSGKVTSPAGKRQPSGILKKAQAPRRNGSQDLTGRFSVKSAISGMSLPSQATRSDISVSRRHSDSERFELDVEENMTSALFIDDITLESRKRAARRGEQKEAVKFATETQTTGVPRKPIAVLSSEARRVLDGLCNDHDCSNCIMCVRINAHSHDVEGGRDMGKKVITITRPVPVTDRITNPVSADADITLRPAQEPGLALATVLKGLNDDLAHLEVKISRKNKQLGGLDPSFARRQRKQVNGQLQRLMREREVKQDQIYRIYDVIEGQKQAGQQMSQAEVDITVSSITNMMGDDTWDGISDDDY